MDYQEHLLKYAKAYETLSADKIEHLGEVMTADIRFVDPHNDITGLAKVQALFGHMFDVMDNPVFVITHVGMIGDEGFLRWRMGGTLKSNGKDWPVEGMSMVRFAADGRVCEHIDYWDAGQQFYERLPVIGALIRAIRRRVAL